MRAHQLTQALRQHAAPGAVGHAGEHGGEGELVARGAAVAHAAAPLEVAALQRPVADGRGRRARHGCRRTHDHNIKEEEKKKEIPGESSSQCRSTDMGFRRDSTP